MSNSLVSVGEPSGLEWGVGPPGQPGSPGHHSLDGLVLQTPEYTLRVEAPADLDVPGREDFPPSPVPESATPGSPVECYSRMLADTTAQGMKRGTQTRARGDESRAARLQGR